ncbi:hypothetical protein NDU88_005284 [Pleurodeles waltl]|uniref:Uncharacterized protein n=1 Tax=Pleurodeles waltl TaxID=8319 RepID=A0AAV7LKW4_PLEWA|nr:hypothetical protein NDU88_005284 [Pleurodeles waltl]
MAHATGERAPAFTAQELEKLVDGVLPQYALLYGPPDQQVQYSPLSSAPAFVLLVEEQEDNRWEYVEFGFHAVLIPRGVYGGERFPFEMAVSAVFLSAGLPPRKRWRIGVL